MHQPAQSPGYRGGRRPSRRAATLREIDRTVADLWSATASRRIETHRINRHRAVFVYQAPIVDRTEDAEPTESRFSSARLRRLRTREPFNPLAATVLRPLTDATNTLNILREILRGPR